MSVLKGDNLSISFGERNIVDEISINIDKGKIVSIIGPNGSGKTTLLRLLCRNLRPRSGVVLINERNIFDMKIKAVARELAIMTQSHDNTGGILVRELVEYGRFPYRNILNSRTEEDNDIVDWALARTGMMKFAEREVDTLSGGERQKVWLAMALAQKPKILLLDEPTTFLDIYHQIEILDLIHSLNSEEGLTIVMVLHDINQAAKYSDEIVVVKDGQVYKKDEPIKIINKKTMREVFGVSGDITIDKQNSKPIFIPKSICS